MGNEMNRPNYGNRNNSYSKDQNVISPEQQFKEMVFQECWITKEADEQLVIFAEKAGKYLKENNLTNSQIRNVYGEIKRIQMKGYEKEKASFFLLRPKVAYALGRDSQNKGLKLFSLIFNSSAQAVNNDKSYRNFCNLIEAILAYHKANGGK